MNNNYHVLSLETFAQYYKNKYYKYMHLYHHNFIRGLKAFYKQFPIALSKIIS